MEITFWGVRGSIAAPGPEFNRYGGNTPCVSIRTRDEKWVILDAGTGITVLGNHLMKTPFAEGKGEGILLITHPHWDHIQGFPFFAPIFIKGNRFTIYGPCKSPAMMEGILEGQMNPHFSPVQSLRNLGAEIKVKATQEGVPFTYGSLAIEAYYNPHGRCSALAYRLTEGGSSLVYAPDAGYPSGMPNPKVQKLYNQATLLIHDCTYTEEDQIVRKSRGYSSIAETAHVAAQCRVKTLAMFHYDQDYTDVQVDELHRRCREYLDHEHGGKQVQLIAAAEGLTLTI